MGLLQMQGAAPGSLWCGLVPRPPLPFSVLLCWRLPCVDCVYRPPYPPAPAGFVQGLGGSEEKEVKVFSPCQVAEG